MKIRNRIALQFTVIVASILVTFSVLVYSVSANFREEEFNDRLYNKAITTCRFLVMVKEVDVDLLHIIDKNTLTTLIDENVLVFNRENRLIYTGGDSIFLQYDHDLLEMIRREGEIEMYQGENQLVGFLYEEGDEPLVVLASANDKFGNAKLHNLRQTLWWSLSIGIGLTVLLSIHFAGNSLRPISEINDQISSITAKNLKQRLPEANSYDEIGQLASNFNDVLSKLEQAFEKQRSFVYHASHELRTPLAALKSEIQLAEKRMADHAEAGEVFSNLSSDTERLISITNSLLLFARSLEDLGQVQMERVRIEDVLFSAKKELQFANAGSIVHIDYANLPEDENHTLVEGNEELLKRVCLNLMDNACKYSECRTVTVTIRTDKSYCYLLFEDEGIGISEDDLPHVFDVFYRGGNAIGHDGFGIGLSICQRIVEIHGGKILVLSKLNQGSRFSVQLRHI
ncbi:MAG: two-component sensor histidine kinase [Cytophagaceae bacterium SCN 52-12]|nr:MAG: two-component sensor histidine kinase [Cytophagaceae bacterium SCN 52-12]